MKKTLPPSFGTQDTRRFSHGVGGLSDECTAVPNAQRGKQRKAHVWWRGRQTNRNEALYILWMNFKVLLQARTSAIPCRCLNPPLLQQTLRLVDFDKGVVQCFLQRHRLIAEQLSRILAAAMGILLKIRS